ncbi:MAG TPA: GAF domain-containing protein, partial [Terracidiphilus sp.]|nr:GAF domain-containing protein [Terracidiphilus sp.]
MAQRIAASLCKSRVAAVAAAFLLACPGLMSGQAAPQAAPKSAAEVGMPIVTNYSTKQYDGPGQVWTIAQDHRGVMFFGVSNGLVMEYDGVTWRKIFIPSNVTRSIVCDQSGRLWVGGNNEFGYLTPDAAGKLTYVSLLDKIPAEHRSFTDVWQILPTPQGTYFRSYETLFRWDGKKMQVWASGPNSSFEALSEVHGHVYTSQASIGLEEIVGDQLRPVPGGDGYKSAAKLFLHPYDGSRILVSQRDGLLSLYDGQKVTPFPTSVDAYLKKHEVYTSLRLKDGSICVTTLNGGVVILDHDGKLRQVLDEGAGLLSSEGLSAFQDNQGGLWVGSDPGISHVDIQSPISIFSRGSALDFLRYKGTGYVTSVSGNSAIFRLDFDPQSHRSALHALHGPSQAWNMIDFKDAAYGATEQLLVATSEGVMRLQGDAVVPAMPAVHGLHEQAYFILQSRKDPSRIFIGHSNGLSSMRWDGHQWIDEGRLPNLLYQATALAEAMDGTLWVSGASGRILRVTVAPTGMRDSKVQILTKAQGVVNAPSDAELVGGQIYVTYQRTAHIYRWDAAQQRLVQDDRFLLPVDGPGMSAILVPIGDHAVWSTTITLSGSREGMFTQAADGSWHLEENAFRDLKRFGIGFIRRDTDGSYWFLGDALLHFSLGSAHAAPPPIPTLVRQVRNGSAVLFGGVQRPGASALKLPPASNNLHFQFAALSYSNPAGTEYQYQLEGVDKDWSQWDKQTEANYSGLGPGSYRFRVHSRTDDGQLGEEGDFSFVILPPWYRTTLAYAAYVLLFLLLGMFGWSLISKHERNKARRRTEILEEQARTLEATVNERTQEIRTQAAEIAAQRDSIDLLSQIGREITASLDLNTILFKLYERVNQIADASIFGVGLYRPEKRLIEYSLAIENGKRYAPYTRSMDDKNQFAVWCIEHRQSILINDAESQYKEYISDYDHAGHTLEDGSLAQPPVSMIYLPLIAQERVLGVLSIQSFKKNAYTEQHLSLLENLASYTTIALDNANAYLLINLREQEVQERAAELMTINRISQALATQLDKEQLILFVGDQVRDLFQAPIAYVSLLDRETMTLHFPYAYGEEAEARPFGTGLTSQIICTGQPLLINEDMDHKRATLGIEQMGRQTASYLGVPIPSGGQVIGVLSVQSTDQEGRFTEADQRLLSTIASAVGVAFHNARLFEETRLARASAEEADAAKSAFLSTVSHELRTPLTSVLGFAKIIRRRLEERIFPIVPEEDRKVLQAKQQIMENLGVVVSEGERLTKLIDDVLDLAKIEAGKFTWNMESVSLAEVVERATSATASLLEARSLPMVRDVEPDLPTITGDKDRLIQVIINLISNAVKFTDSGSIQCRVRQEDGDLVVSVTDSGIGIAPADQPKVFEKFKQVGDTLTDKPKGTGLGLPICKEIVEHHGGRIWVESTPGAGSTFSFSLPVAGQSAQLELLPARRSVDIESIVKRLRETVANHDSENKSVLVVDDDPNIRSLLNQELTDA